MQLAGEHFFRPQDETLAGTPIGPAGVASSSRELLSAAGVPEGTDQMLQSPGSVAIGAAQAAAFEERLQRRSCCAYWRQDNGDDLDDQLPGGAAVGRARRFGQEQDEVHGRDDQRQYQYNPCNVLETDVPMGVEDASCREPLLLVKDPQIVEIMQAVLIGRGRCIGSSILERITPGLTIRVLQRDEVEGLRNIVVDGLQALSYRAGRVRRR